jgi:hypothetical protein
MINYFQLNTFLRSHINLIVFYFLIKSRLARLWAEEHAMAMYERSKGFRFRGLVLKMAKLLSLKFPYMNTKNS